MKRADEGSVTVWIGDLKRDADTAAEELWERYFGQLVRLAAARLRGASRAAADEEDVALSAFDSFCRNAERGRFPRLEDRNDLWRILVTITTRKATDQRQWQGRRKRGGGLVLDEAALEGPEAQGRARGLVAVAGREPTPEFAAIVTEEYRRRLDTLPDDVLRRIAQWKLEGERHEEIARRLDCSVRSVERKLALIRRYWLTEEPT
ncbi:ECF-type sigma factor [Tautonia rosea]|uniref:ECF-type sigma factor n=1 Tax=Tautonia rosea TaxID=2728037 RepID=UPI001475F45B|nr:ECF-type sigma factor [Tautonia rosea]